MLMSGSEIATELAKLSRQSQTDGTILFCVMVVTIGIVCYLVIKSKEDK
nr:MAG TPA: Sec20 [Caudoviricetes sp.]